PLGGGGGKARRDRVQQPPAAVPARNQVLGFAVRGFRVDVAQVVGTVAVHHHLAAQHAQPAALGGGAERVHRGRMHGGINNRGGGAVGHQFVEEELRHLGGVRRIRERGLGGKGVFVKPFQQALAVAGDDVGLGIVDVRVDEARHENGAGVVLHL